MKPTPTSTPDDDPPPATGTGGAPPGDGEILAGIAAVARRHLDHDGPLDPGMRLVEDLELDSIRLLTLAVEVENHFRVCLDEEDDRGIETVGDLVAVVRRELRRELAGDGGPGSPTTQP